MGIFFLRTNEPRRDRPGATMTFPFRCGHDSIASLRVALEKGPVDGKKLIYDRIDVGKNIVKREVDYLLSKNGLSSIEEARSKFIDP